MRLFCEFFLRNSVVRGFLFCLVTEFKGVLFLRFFSRLASFSGEGTVLQRDRPIVPALLVPMPPISPAPHVPCAPCLMRRDSRRVTTDMQGIEPRPRNFKTGGTGQANKRLVGCTRPQTGPAGVGGKGGRAGGPGGVGG